MLSNLGIIRRIYLEKLEQKKPTHRRKNDTEKTVKIAEDEPKII